MQHEAKLSGRIVFFRDLGKLIFIKLFNIHGTRQISISLKHCNEFKRYKTELNVGDIVTAEGFMYTTIAGEETLQVVELTVDVKCQKPMPEKWSGIKDMDLRQRYKYIDFIKNEETRRIFNIRSKIIQSIRKFLITKDFIEVETPVLHKVPSGASAKPFITHHNALDIPMYLRIAPEFYLKRFLVAGYDKVFEISRCFRNEGIDTTHLQEFTMLETYEIYKDYEGLKDYAIELIQYLAEAVEYPIDPIKKISYYGFLHKYGQIDTSKIHDYEYLYDLAKERGLDPTPFKSTQTLVDFLYKKLCVLSTSESLLIYDYPSHPLAKGHPKDPNLSQKIQVILNSQEVVNAYMEQNDPKFLEEEFKKQEVYKACGDEEVFETDQDFIEAISYGMPPAAGFGLGIDRLVKIFTNAGSIKDVVFFPIMK